jgi:hypothetical protein
MRVETAIDLLSKQYKPSDELFIVWWDKLGVEEYSDKDIADEDWTDVINKLDEDEYLFFAVNSTIEQLINKREGV